MFKKSKVENRMTTFLKVKLVSSIMPYLFSDATVRKGDGPNGDPIYT